mmetsp:Transcript_62848/g.180819  ORF Transcript_62848/g.180819 Transcript_62848/m.180819 type:complete len:220 (+) Transcript_62848:620-1279(+)
MDVGDACAPPPRLADAIVWVHLVNAEADDADDVRSPQRVARHRDAAAGRRLDAASGRLRVATAGRLHDAAAGRCWARGYAGAGAGAAALRLQRRLGRVAHRPLRHDAHSPRGGAAAAGCSAASGCASPHLGAHGEADAVGAVHELARARIVPDRVEGERFLVARPPHLPALAGLVLQGARLVGHGLRPSDVGDEPHEDELVARPLRARRLEGPGCPSFQ